MYRAEAGFRRLLYCVWHCYGWGQGVDDPGGKAIVQGEVVPPSGSHGEERNHTGAFLVGLPIASEGLRL